MLPLNIHSSILEHFIGIVGGRRLLVTESLSWKDTISGHSESSTCVLLQHIGKKGDQLFMQMKRYVHGSHTTSYAWDDESVLNTHISLFK